MSHGPQTQDAKIAEQKRINENLDNIKNKILVISGKGGVGKSTTAINIAASLSDKGFKVGLMDTDLHGPNTLKMLKLENKQLLSDGSQIIPLEYNENLKVVSIAAMMDEQEAAIIWRGPLKISIIRQFIGDVNWGKLDYLIIDTPPGSGDEPLTVAQTILKSKAVILTTPQEISLMDIKRSVDFCKKLNIDIIGIIENMSGFVCPHCKETVEIFKSGGGEKYAKEKDINFLGKIPLEKDIVTASDDGEPFSLKYKDSKTGKLFSEIINQIIDTTK